MKLAPAGISLDRWLRKILPRSLFGRTLLIVVVPLILLEAVALQIFYGSHLDVLSRRLAGAVAGEIAFVIDEVERTPAEQTRLLDHAAYRFEFRFHFRPDAHLKPREPPHALGPVDTDLERALTRGLGRRFTLAWHGPPGMIRVAVQLQNGVMTIDVPRKRLYVGALYIFFAWLGGTTVLLLTIAILFLRNQVRGIRRLAEAAEAFGMGREAGPIRPEGATEVRRAGTAFNRMQDRISRFLAQRTAMLAGVSHDLRTPLTRLRLAVAMLPPVVADRALMEQDIGEMEQLIALYLDFARGEGAEQPQPVDPAVLLEEVVARAARGGRRIAARIETLPQIVLRPEAIRRALGNLLENALRHGTEVALAADLEGERTLRIVIDDDGPGIAPERRETVFRPFESGEPNGSGRGRKSADLSALPNPDAAMDMIAEANMSGGTGLGLTIARDIIAAHGGDIRLDDSPLGGLRVIVTLPA